ncbi:MAG: N-acetylmuramoyl-L-alanine amidase [Myxococcota bacterium]
MKLVKYTLDFQHSPRSELPTVTQVHYTGGLGVATKWIRQSGAAVSYHCEIARNGDVYLSVPWSREAWHSGSGEILIDTESRPWPNRYTIGIALSNCGLLVEEDGDFFYPAGGTLALYVGPNPVRACLEFDNGKRIEGWWEPYTPEAIDSLVQVLELIHETGYAQAASTLIGHEDTAMPLGRKIDPGPLFPWHALSATRLNPRTQGAAV